MLSISFGLETRSRYLAEHTETAETVCLLARNNLNISAGKFNSAFVFNTPTKRSLVQVTIAWQCPSC
jgi:predicted sulfurtransferase